MSLLNCKEASELILVARDAIREQYELPHGLRYKALEQQTNREVFEANRRLTDHILHCPNCHSDDPIQPLPSHSSHCDARTRRKRLAIQIYFN